jgi:hypothetical protein
MSVNGASRACEVSLHVDVCAVGDEAAVFHADARATRFNNTTKTVRLVADRYMANDELPVSRLNSSISLTLG